jgi:putative protease
MSSVNGGNSGNRGRCSQPCRAKYKTTSVGINHPLNIKDNSAYLDLEEIYKTKVDSIKVEGRIKKYHYVYTVIDSWRKQLERFYNGKDLIKSRDSLYKVFNRDFSNHFLKGEITKDIFIDSPRNYSLDYFIKKSNLFDKNRIEKMKNKLFNEKQSLDEIIKEKIDNLIIKKLDSDIKKRKKIPFINIKTIEQNKYKKQKEEHKVTPLLSILIASEKDLEFCDSSHEIFFQLPDSLSGKYNYFITLFKNNRYLIPYFSSILIGDDYSLATKFLDELNPKLIVTNNTGIAFYAYKKDISWIAGPFLNITNSYSLISLKENFNCYGAFISNEINKNQI